MLGKLLDVLHKEIHAVEPAVLEIVDLRMEIVQADHRPVIEQPALDANLDIVHGFRLVHPVRSGSRGNGIETLGVEAARPEPGCIGGEQHQVFDGRITDIRQPGDLFLIVHKVGMFFRYAQIDGEWIRR